jgi:hypothetical protein
MPPVANPSGTGQPNLLPTPEFSQSGTRVTIPSPSSTLSICVQIPGQVSCAGVVVIVPTEFPDVSVTDVDPSKFPEENFGSPVVDVSFSDYSLTDILQFSVEICFPGVEYQTDSCLSFLDESKNPPQWKCEDECLETRNNLLCGSTTHFTVFAILLGSVSSGGCSSNVYVTGSFNGDLALCLAVAGFVVILACLVIAFSQFKYGKLIMFGAEHERIRELREKSLLHSTTAATSWCNKPNNFFDLLSPKPQWRVSGCKKQGLLALVFPGN